MEGCSIVIVSLGISPQIAVSLQIVIFHWVFLIVHLYKTLKSADWYRHRSILTTSTVLTVVFFFGDVPSLGFHKHILV